MLLRHKETGRVIEVADGTRYPQLAYEEIQPEALKPEPKPLLAPEPDPEPETPKEPAKKKSTPKKKTSTKKKTTKKKSSSKKTKES